jgi:quercetin dioxygenase-like cupin family protein
MSSSEQQAPGIGRADLQRHDLSVPGREVVQARVEIGPEAPFVKHTLPGEEIIYRRIAGVSDRRWAVDDVQCW